MRWFLSGPLVPAAVRAQVPGKVLAAVEAQDGTWLAGTRERFHAIGPDGDAGLVLRWEGVQRADWDSDERTLTVERIEEFGRPVTAYTFVVPDPGMLLQLVRERVTASVLLQRRFELERKRGFSVIARRAPSGGGEVTWAYEFDKGVDPDHPAVMAAAEAALRDARESLGL
jgi:hypothetical protein